MLLNLGCLEKAISSMERALNFADERINFNNISMTEEEVIKAGVIHNFEITYQLCWKFMKKVVRSKFNARITRWGY